jgi:hypothetical protein
VPDLLPDWRTQVLVWGWAILGSEAPRPALRNPASILECRDRWEPPFHVWDRKPEGERWHGDRQVPIPDWWGLHYFSDEAIHQAFDEEHVVEQAEAIVDNWLAAP